MQYTREDKLRLHILKQHTMQQKQNGLMYISCPQCDKKFKLKERLKAHIQSEHNDSKNISCDLCSKKFMHFGNLLVHMEKFHKGVKFDCQQCEKKFVTMSDLNSHVQLVHNGNGVKFSCNQCDREFTTVGNLKNHIKASHDSEDCDSQFSSQTSHDNSIPIVDKGFKFACRKCDEKFKTHVSLQRHIKTVHECIKKFSYDHLL